MKRCLIAAAIVLSSATAAAQSHPACTGSQLGTWKLRSMSTTYVDTGETVQPYGSHPTGYLSYGRDCRMYAIIALESRKVPAGTVPTDAEKAVLFNDFVAYAGTYTIDGDKVSHHVDVSWNEAWTGTTQVRQFKIDGNVLHIRSMPAKNPRDGRVSWSALEWIRVQ
jgi:hypothetical protein